MKKLISLALSLLVLAACDGFRVDVTGTWNVVFIDGATDEIMVDLTLELSEQINPDPSPTTLYLVTGQVYSGQELISAVAGTRADNQFTFTLPLPHELGGTIQATTTVANQNFNGTFTTTRGAVGRVIGTRQ